MAILYVSDIYTLFNANKIAAIPYFGPRTMGYGLAGSVLMDLTVLGKVEIVGNSINIIDTSPIEDNFLDGVLSYLSQLENNKKIKYYINSILKNGVYIFQLFTDHLESLNYMKLSFNIKRFLPTVTVDFVNNDLREQVFNNIREILLENKPLPDKSSWYVLSLLRATSSYKNIFGKEHKKQVKNRMKELIGSEPIGKGVRRVIRDAESATPADSGD
ncbi:MAG: GPP34 family phosphoprotein [Candidatus Hodarchaeota archaeon]